MTCCGNAIKKAGSIMQGNVNFVADKALSLFGLPTKRYHLAEVRKAVCRKCEKHTWMTAAEYLGFLNDHKIEVVKNLADLTVLPELPKQDYQKGRKLFCMLCKCWLPAKASVEKEKCPLDKWPAGGV